MILPHARNILRYVPLEALFVSELNQEVKKLLGDEYADLFTMIDFMHHENIKERPFLDLALMDNPFEKLEEYLDLLKRGCDKYYEDNPLCRMFEALNPFKFPHDYPEAMKAVKQDKEKQIKFFTKLREILPEAVQRAQEKSQRRLEALSYLS